MNKEIAHSANLDSLLATEPIQCEEQHCSETMIDMRATPSTISANQ
jgi:hypothetical protein